MKSLFLGLASLFLVGCGASADSKFKGEKKEDSVFTSTLKTSLKEVCAKLKDNEVTEESFLKDKILEIQGEILAIKSTSNGGWIVGITEYDGEHDLVGTFVFDSDHKPMAQKLKVGQTVRVSGPYAGHSRNDESVFCGGNSVTVLSEPDSNNVTSP